MVGRVTILGILLLAAPWHAAAFDTDSDGIPDVIDNCSFLANGPPLYEDVDQDGFGNLCDPDYDNDLLVDDADVAILGANLGRFSPPGGAVTDTNLDGVTGIPDALLLREHFGGPPGPSGLACAGTSPCP